MQYYIIHKHTTLRHYDYRVCYYHVVIVIVPLSQIIGHQACLTSQVGPVIGQRNISQLSAQFNDSFLASLTSAQLSSPVSPHPPSRHNMISLSRTTFFLLSLTAQTIASLATADTGEVEEVLYKDANTVETFMRTREFKVSPASYSYPQPLTPHI